MSVNSVWLLKYPFPAQQKFSIENLGLYLHVEPTPTTKKLSGGIFLIFEVRINRGPLRGHFFNLDASEGAN